MACGEDQINFLDITSQPDKKSKRILLTDSMLPKLSIKQFMQMEATKAKYCFHQSN